MQTLGTPQTLNPPPPGSEPETLEPAAQAKTLEMTEQGLGLGFSHGDFVWGKVKNHPWWPGQVYAPSEASDRAQKAHRKDHDSILVAYFGDDTFAWCNPSRLKPFLENFQQMASSGSSKSFRAALESALREVGKCVVAELSCNCLPEEERSGVVKYFGKNARVSKYEPGEFLSLVKDAAVETSVVNALQVSMLRSWVVAFERGVDVGHRRKAVADLVDKIDLDVPLVEVTEEGWISGSGAVEGPEISWEKSYKSRKQRSMAALIAQMDMGSIESSDDEEDKKKESAKGLEVENGNVGGGGVKEGEAGSGRRERKKSKYLSPPYTYLSGGFTKSLASPKSLESKIPKSLESKTPKSSRALPSGSSSTILKCSSEEVLKEEDKKSGTLFQITDFDTGEVLSAFLAMAANSLHSKWNRSAKIVRGLFAEFRSSVYSSGAGFDAYQKRLAESVGVDDKIVNKEVGDKPDEGKKSVVKRVRKRKDTANGEGETQVDSGHQTAQHSDKKDKAAPKRKMMKEGANGKIPETSKTQAVAVSDEGNSGQKKRNSKADPDQKTTVGLSSCKPVNNVELGKTGQKLVKGKEVTNRRIPTELDSEVHGQKTVDLGGCKPVNNVEWGKIGHKLVKEKEVTNRGIPTKLDSEVNKQTKEATSGQKRKKSKNGPVFDVPINLGAKVSNGSEGGKPRPKKKNKDATGHEDPAALLLTFSSGTSIPSKEDLISAFSNYGPLIQSETELIKDSSSARVVFGRSSDAEKAFNDKVRAMGQPVASYRLRYLTGNLSSPPAAALTPIQVPKPPLPYIRKSLERMISTLSGSPIEKVAGTSEGLKPEARDNLVGEMQGLLTKVDKMLSGPAAGTST